MPYTPLRDILKNAVRTAGVQRGNIQAFDPASRTLRIVADQGFGPEFLEHFRIVQLFDSTPCGRAATITIPITVDDVMTDASYEAHRSIAQASGYRSVLSLPLLSKGGLVGVMSVHAHVPHAQWPFKAMEAHARAAAEVLGAIGRQ